MSRDFFRNRCKLGSIPQVPALVILEKAYTFDSAPSDMTLSVEKTPFGFSGGNLYANPSDGRGTLISDYNLNGYDSVSAKIKIQNNDAYWWNYAELSFIDASGNSVAWIASDIASGGGRKQFSCSQSGVQSFSSVGVYYLEIVATKTSITFKVYNSSNVLLYTLTGAYMGSYSFADIRKVKIYLWGSDSSVYVDSLWVSAIKSS